MMPEEGNKIQEIGGVEGAVFEAEHPFEVSFLVAHDELMRGVVHEVHQLPAFADDGGTVAPGKNGRQETGDLDILLFAEQVRDADRIGGDKIGPVVLGGFCVQEFG